MKRPKLSKPNGDSKEQARCDSIFIINLRIVSTPLLACSNINAMFLPDHFHVHVVNANHSGFKGVSAGQAHLLEDIISLVRTLPIF